MGSNLDSVYQEGFEELLEPLIAFRLVEIGNHPPRINRHASGMAASIAVREFLRACNSEVVNCWHHTKDIVAEHGIQGAVVEFVQLVLSRDDIRGETACWEELCGTASCGLSSRLGLREAATLVALELWRRDEATNSAS